MNGDRCDGRLLICFSLLATVFLGSCGYVGDPLPPALNIPKEVIDLRVAERGDALRIEFTAPELTTDQIGIRRLSAIELTADSEPVPVPSSEPGKTVSLAIPAARFAGRTVRFQVRSAASTGKWSDWSKPVEVEVVAPLAPPASLRATATAGGVRLSWESSHSLRVRRKTPAENEFQVVVELPGGTEWVDTAARFGETYEYQAQTFQGAVESEWSAPISIAPADTFPPSVPAGLTAITGVSSIELLWERSPEDDVAGYRVFRAAAGSDRFEPLGELVDAPNYSDRAVTAGATYRYRVASVDLRGNQSAMSDPVEAMAP